MLSRLASAAVAGLVVVACASAPPPATDPPQPAQVAARWVADDGTVVVVNLVALAGTDARGARAIAEQERTRHTGARVIVRVFAPTAGAERYVVGHVPTRDEPLRGESRSQSLIALYDFPR